MRILVLIAGTNDPSNSATLADVFCDGLHRTGATIDRIALKDLRIEHFTLAHYEKHHPEEDDFRRIHAAFDSCDGFVIASPIWNFATPGHCKNLIDRIGVFGLDEQTRSKGQLGKKPFYILFTGGTPMPVWKGLMEMTTSFVREAFRYFGATYIGTYFEPKCVRGSGKFGLVVDRRPDSLLKVRSEGERFGKIVRTFAETGQLPAGRKVAGVLYKIGNAIVKRL